jgi:hypothetical protein
MDSKPLEQFRAENPDVEVDEGTNGE